MGILSSETEALLRTRAALSGETPDALVQRLLNAPAKRPIDMDAIRAIQERHRTRPVLDDRPLKVIRDELWGM